MADAMAQLCYGFPLKKINKKLQKAINVYRNSEDYDHENFTFNECELIINESYDNNGEIMVCLAKKNYESFGLVEIDISLMNEISNDNKNYEKLVFFAEKFDIKIKPLNIKWYLLATIF